MADLRQSTDLKASGRRLRCGRRTLDLERPHVMGVLNLTPDSFSDGGRFDRAGALDIERVVDAAHAMLDAGATILDVGGESTRPGAAPVTADEECRRVLPVLERLLALDAVVSIDTSKPVVAQRALALGTHIVNDVTGLTDPRMLEAVGDSDAGIVIMHMRGEPRSMQRNPRYDDVVEEVGGFLSGRLSACQAAGIDAARLCIDPGFGFGKTVTHNLLLLRELAMLKNTGAAAVLVGLSRKSTIGTITGREVGDRLAGSLAAVVLAIERGADIVRVHDVAETVDAIAVWRAMIEA